MNCELDLLSRGIVESARELFAEIETLPLQSKVAALNEIRLILHHHSPFRAEPVDCVLWYPNERVVANDYNPNSVAPPEMRLLETSIMEDGFTQPIVGWDTEENITVVDGFHRNRVGKESKLVTARVHGYLPVAVINEGRVELGDRISATIRHNRARGKHKVEAMSDIVIELKRRNWTNEKICKNLGMDQDEILRLTQITGLAEMFTDSEFSASWELDEMPEPSTAELEDGV